MQHRCDDLAYGFGRDERMVEIVQEIGVFGLVSALFFLLILTFGLAYAWRKGALEWK